MKALEVVIGTAKTIFGNADSIFVAHSPKCPKLGQNAVTVRDRDTWDQERVGVDALKDYLHERLK